MASLESATGPRGRRLDFALVRAAAAIVAIIPLPGFGLFPLAWSALGAVLWLLVCLFATANATAVGLFACVAMFLACASVVWLLLPTTWTVSGGTSSPYTTRIVQGFAVTMPILLVGVVAIPAILPPNELSREQYAFCTSDHERLFGGQQDVSDIAALSLNELAPETSVVGPYQAPQWAAAVG